METARYGKEILATLSQTLSWSHFMKLLPLEKPHLLDFLGLSGTFQEKDLEAAILCEMAHDNAVAAAFTPVKLVALICRVFGQINVGFEGIQLVHGTVL